MSKPTATATPTSALSAAAQSLIAKAASERDAARKAQQELDAEFASPAVAASPASPAAVSAPPPPVRRYTPQALINLMIEHPQYTHKQFAAHFGYPPSWFAAVLSSDRFQQELEPRRAEISNPLLTGTLEDLYRAVTVQSLSVIQSKLDSPAASEALILKSAELGVKALAMKKQEADPAADSAVGNVSKLASRLLSMIPQAQPPAAARDFTIEASLNELPK